MATAFTNPASVAGRGSRATSPSRRRSEHETGQGIARSRRADSDARIFARHRRPRSQRIAPSHLPRTAHVCSPLLAWRHRRSTRAFPAVGEPRAHMGHSSQLEARIMFGDAGWPAYPELMRRSCQGERLDLRVVARRCDVEETATVAEKSAATRRREAGCTQSDTGGHTRNVGPVLASRRRLGVGTGGQVMTLRRAGSALVPRSPGGSGDVGLASALRRWTVPVVGLPLASAARIMAPP